MIEKDVKKIKDEMKEEQKEKPLDIIKDGVSSGSTLLNLALTDTPYCGYILGKIVNVIGDSSAGKSFLLWTLFAEATYYEKLKNYELIYDEPESSLEFDVPSLFGERTHKRVNLDIISDTIQEWHDNIVKEANDGKSFIYGLDSFDALTSNEEINQKDITKGGYRTEKAVISGQILRKIKRMVKETKSLVVVVSQTRDNIGVMFGEKKVRSGGKALKFYSTHEIWLAVKSHIKRKERDVGVNVIAKIKKNKITGKLRTVEFPILFDYGVDDITSMVEWMIKEGFWGNKKGGGRKIYSIDLGIEGGYVSQLVKQVEEKNLVNKLRMIVAKKWKQIEDEITTKRMKKY